jgi:NAD(P)-dependent dehydrogenase (short-subunit alcohol dehydrogenase family)
VARIWVIAGAEGVVIAGRRQEKFDEVIASARQYNKGSTKVIGVKTDVKIDTDTDNLFEQVRTAFGRPADVVYANAGWVSELKPSAEESVKTWWSVYVSADLPLPIPGPGSNTEQEVNVLGVHNTARSWIKSQPEPTKPVGTIINVNSGLAGYLMSGNSAYGSSKIAVHRYMEFLDLGELSVLILLISSVY